MARGGAGGGVYVYSSNISAFIYAVAIVKPSHGQERAGRVREKGNEMNEPSNVRASSTFITRPAFDIITVARYRCSDSVVK